MLKKPSDPNKTQIQISLRADDAQAIGALVKEWQTQYGKRLRGLRIEPGKKSSKEWFAYGTLEIDASASPASNSLADDTRWQVAPSSTTPKPQIQTQVISTTSITPPASTPVPADNRTNPKAAVAKARISRRREVNARPDDKTGEKVCTACGLKKSVSEFTWRSDRQSFTSACKACRRKKDAERYANNPAKAKEHSLKVVRARKRSQEKNGD